MQSNEHDARYKWPKRLASALLLLLWSSHGLAQQQPVQTEVPTLSTTPASDELGSVTTLEPIVVTSTRSDTPLSDVPAAVSIVNSRDIQLGQPTIGLDESLNRVPGVFIQNAFNFAQDQRISIRGFGTRAAFGVREIRLVIDGIPETSPDGQTELDNIDLGAIRRMEVLRGPASSLYGNASGGVINILTEDGPATPFAETRLTGGSFGLQKYQAKTGGQFGPLNLLFNTSYFSLNGFRDHSRAQSTLFTGKLRYTIDPRSDLTMLLSFADSPLAEDPGSLTRAQVKQNREQARDTNLTLDGGESLTQGKLGLVYRNEFLPGHEVIVTQYTLFRQFDNKLPILPRFGSGIVKFDRFGIGGGVKYGYNTDLYGFRNRILIGVDIQHQSDNRRRFNNDNGARGALRFHQDEDVTSVGPFIREEFYLCENLQLSAGLRYDSFEFSVDDHFRNDGNDSGGRTLDQLSPMGGVLYSPLQSLHLYANVSTAFQVPTTTELANPNEGGGFNPDVDPQQAINYELGARGTFWKRFSYDVALFWIVLDDALIQFEGESGRTFFRNAGRSERQGAELHFDVPLTTHLVWTLSYTYLDATFDRYIAPAGRFDDNDEPGIPPHQLFTELLYSHPSGFYGAFNLLFVDDFFADDANTTRTNAYTVLNLRLGYEVRVGRGRIAPFVGFNNITDEDYNGLVRLNSLGGRFFEPAPGFNVYGGVTMTYEF
jgi:iron complex outermembrane recepter protein